MLKVLGHSHVLEVGILISSGSDIIIQIRTRGFGVIWLASSWARRTPSRPTYTRHYLHELGYARHRSGCPVSFARLCAHKPSCWDKLNARCGLMADVKAFCVVMYLCPRSFRWLVVAGKQQGRPSCYQETKTAFRWAVHSQVSPNGRPSAWRNVFRAHAQSVT